MQKNIGKGIILLVLSSFFYALMSVFVSYAGELPFFQKALFRNGVSLLISAIIILNKRPSLSVRGEYRFPLLCRIVCGTLSVFCNYYAIDHMPLATANALNKLGPFFAVLFAALWLRERADRRQVICIGIALLGSLILIIAGLTTLNFAVLIAFMGGVFSGGVQTSIRAVQRGEGMDSAVVVFYFSLVSTLVTLLPSVLAWKLMSVRQLLTLMGAGCSCAAAQFCLTSAFRYAPPKDISLYDCSQIVFSAIMGFVFFAQIPLLSSMTAYTLIIAASVLLLICHRQKETQA